MLSQIHFNTEYVYADLLETACNRVFYDGKRMVEYVKHIASSMKSVTVPLINKKCYERFVISSETVLVILANALLGSISSDTDYLHGNISMECLYSDDNTCKRRFEAMLIYFYENMRYENRIEKPIIIRRVITEYGNNDTVMLKSSVSSLERAWEYKNTEEDEDEEKSQEKTYQWSQEFQHYREISETDSEKKEHYGKWLCYYGGGLQHVCDTEKDCDELSSHIKYPKACYIRPANRFVDFSTSSKCIDSSKIYIIHGNMEMTRTPNSFVDFANAQIHIGEIIGSLTQEEALFSSCPELFMAMILCEDLEYNEAVIVNNVKRYSDFCNEFIPVSDNSYHDVLIIDSSYENSYNVKNIFRDIYKAYTAFNSTSLKTITTGNWGCGVFGNSYKVKFIQQVIAFTMTDNEKLEYYVTNEEQYNDLCDILKMIENKPISQLIEKIYV